MNKSQRIIEYEREMAIALTRVDNLEEALHVCLKFILNIADMDCGGIYLLDSDTGRLKLEMVTGLSDEFISHSRDIPAEDPRNKTVMAGVSTYYDITHVLSAANPVFSAEGIRCYGMIPLVANEKVIASVNFASHSLDEVPHANRKLLEIQSTHVGNIIARFLAQRELLESRNELQSMFDTLQDMLFILDEAGNIIQINRSVTLKLGYLPGDLIGHSVLEVHPPGRRDEAGRIVADMLAGVLDLCPISLIRKDGSELPVETRVAPGRWGNHNVLIGISRDVSERVAAEAQRLMQTRMLEYRNEFEEILTGISTRMINMPAHQFDNEINSVLARVGMFEKVDRSYLFLYDFEKQTMNNTHEWCGAGIEPSIGMLQDIPLSEMPWWTGNLDTGQEIHIPQVSAMPEEAITEKNILEAQSIQSVLVVPVMINNRTGGFLGFDSVINQRTWLPDSILMIRMVSDIIANAVMRQQMETEVADSETRNRALLEAVPDLIIRLDKRGNILDYKAGQSHRLIPGEGLIIGTNFNNYLETEYIQDASEKIKSTLATGKIQTSMYTIKAGEVRGTFEVRFIRSNDNEVFTIIRDITEQVHLENMKTDFINRTSHELRTPVATMVLMAELIDDDPGSSDFSQYWQIMKEELNRERMLLDDLLSTGRLETGSMALSFRDVNLDRLLDKVILAETPKMERKDLHLKLDTRRNMDSPARILADEKALQQVLTNLIGNAIKFTPEGGSIEIGLQPAGEGFSITVADTGIGIPGEDLPLLYTRFFRGANAIKEEVPGTGIGLYIVKGIIEKHHGTIVVHSEEGKGSRFTVWLPESPAESVTRE